MHSSASLTQPHTLTTPLHGLHLELRARMVPFAGYEMPVQFPSGLMAEHQHTRHQASLFDVSHMGQIRVSGAGAAQALEYLLPIDAIHLPLNQQRYALLLNHDGGILDDLMVIRRSEDFLLIVNAAHKQSDWLWLQQHMGAHCELAMLEDQALLALQGPAAAEVLQTLIPQCNGLRFMQGMDFTFQGAGAYVTRSGYTGEDGFEISIPAAQSTALARQLLQHPSVQPAGLGARNSLRLEAGLCLHGNDILPSHTPSSARLQWSISPARRTAGVRAGGFIGADAVLPEVAGARPVSMLRTGLKALERIPVRDGCSVQLPSGEAIGNVTSGLLSPSLDQPIAMAYLPTAYSVQGTLLHALVRGKAVPMEVTSMPFVPTRYCKT